MRALVGGKIYTMEGKIYEKGILLMEKGKIKAVGEDVELPEGVEIIDVSGQWVFPGFIDAHSHIGLFEEGVGEIGEEGNEATDPITPQLRAIDGINPGDMAFKDAIKGGITCAFTGPGSANVIGGQAVVMKTHGKIVDHMVIKAPAGLKVAFGENPKRVYGEQKKMPATGWPRLHYSARP